MADSFFNNPALSALSGQMAQAWQSTLETWWKALLNDAPKLAELARCLAEAGPAGGAGPTGGAGPAGASRPVGASPEDVARVIDALELMEKRITGLEGQLREVTGSLAAVVGYLERQSSGPIGEGGGSEAAGKTKEG